jgi:hypothetical protein
MESRDNATIVLGARRARAALPAIRDAAQRELPSEVIPQADRIDRVFGLVELAFSGEEITADTLKVTPRQVNYYKQACRILRLLSEHNTLTPGGALVAKLDVEERYSVAAVLFENSDCGAAWVAWSQVRNLAELNPDDALDFILDSVPTMSTVTARRRAQTLAAWQRELAPFHYAWSGKKGTPPGA